MMEIMTFTGGLEGKFEDTLDHEKTKNFLLFLIFLIAHWMIFDEMMTN